MKIKLLISLLLMCLILVSCKKENVLVEDNTAPAYNAISSILIENYVNRVFIDLIGREPLDDELAQEAATLKETNVSIDSRKALIQKLQIDTAFIPVDTSYRKAYYHWFYESAKGRIIQGASVDEINVFKNNALSALTVLLAADTLDTAAYFATLASLDRIQEVFEIERLYEQDSIDLKYFYKILIDNQVYDEINMGSFNFVRATFDNLYHRYPTEFEFNTGFEMVEDNEWGTLFDETSYGKDGYMEILTNTREFYQGIIIWVYQKLLARNPSSAEAYNLMITFYNDGNFQKIEEAIMITDEYANF